MRERPILFSGPMVRAIGDGSKTQTRRVARIPWLPGANPHFSQASAFHNGPKWRIAGSEEMTTGFYCPYGKPGDRLWVKETYRFNDWTEDGEPFIRYAADGAVRFIGSDDIPEAWHERLADIWAELSSTENWDAMGRAADRKWRSARFIPRWASRYTLEVVERRLQRLQDISEDDARAEAPLIDGHSVSCRREPIFREGVYDCDCEHETYIDAFRDLWESINAKRSPWSRNDLVWAVTFRRVEP